MRALLVAIVLAGTATTAAAYPQFQVSREQTCGSCHLSPDGGGLLGEYGEMTAEDDAKWGGDPRFLHGAIDLPEWLHAGGDVRAAGGASDAGGGIGGAVFPMQVEARVAATKGQITLFADAGITLPREGEPITALMSREHYLLWKQTDTGDGWYARAGRFQPVYGLRLAEHTAYTRRFGGSPLFSEIYGASVGWISAEAEVHLTGFVHDRLRPNVESGDGASGYAEKRFGQRALGLEARYARSPDKVRFEGGVTGKWWLGGPSVLLGAEVVGIHESIDAGSAGNYKRDAYAGNLMATWFPAHSFFVDLVLGTYDENWAVEKDYRDAAEVNVHWFAHSHLELVLMGRLQMIGLGDGGPNSGYGLLQVHYRI